MKIKKYKVIITTFILILACSTLLSGCGNFLNRNISPTPDVEGYGNYPAVIEPLTFNNMNCTLITRVSKGFSWNGITIGKTTYREIIESLDPSRVAWNSREGNLSFKIEDYYFETCFVGDSISALELRPPNLMVDQRYETIYDYVEVFGPPDLITWGERNDNRTVLWAEQGFVASALTRDDTIYGEIFGLVIISPFSPLMKNQWLVEAIEADPPEQCVFDSDLKGYSYDGYQSCCLDPFFGTDEEECGIIEGYEPREDSL